MNKTLIVAQWELKRGLRSKAFIFSLFMPFIVLMFSILPTIFAMNSKIESKDIGIIDQGNAIYSELSKHLKSQIITSEGEAAYTIQEYQTTPTNHDVLVESLVADDIVSIVLVIEPDFKNNAQVNIYHSDAVGLEEISQVRRAIKQFSMEKRIVALGMTKEDMDYVLESPDVTVFEVSDASGATQSNLLVRYAVPGIFLWLLVMGIVMSSSMLISGVIEERSNRIIEIMMSSIKPNQLMAGKILGIGMLGIVQITFYLLIVLILTLFGSSFTEIDISAAEVFTPKIILYFIYFIMGYFMYASLYVSLGSLYDNERDASQSVGFLSLFAIIPIMLIQPIMMNPDTPLAGILSFIPLTTPFMMILKIGMLSAPLWEVLLMMLYLLAWIILIAWMGSKIFRTTLLMYGKRATLKEIIQWIRS
ncbi:MAG: ABC transporter permease [Candidatus Neomarinimicrobiota bacterium]